MAQIHKVKNPCPNCGIQLGVHADENGDPVVVAFLDEKRKPAGEVEDEGENQEREPETGRLPWEK
jgi:hypothetical protein